MTLLYKSGDDWTADKLTEVWAAIEEVAINELRASYYKPQVEIVTANQMLDAYSSVGMPTMYSHWSHGKQRAAQEKAYKTGKIGLAYELVVNSNPCIAYLMEENNLNVQTMVMAHASVGHSAFFKNNYLFKSVTDAEGIVEYLKFAKSYLKRCEERYGFEEVEHVLDACHALQNYGVDKYKKPKKLNPQAEEARALQRFEQELSDYDDVWEKIGRRPMTIGADETEIPRFDPQENLLYFVEKNAPHLPAWKREVIRIVRKVSVYFSPQAATKVANEGYATFVHYYVMNRLHEKGLIDNGSLMEFYALHANVIAQPQHSQFNPYKLGFMIFQDIKRLAEGGEMVIKGGERVWEPITDEDKHYFPKLVNTDWVEATRYAMENFKDETLILQYLSPKVARDLRMFAIKDDSKKTDYYVTEISDETGFRQLRATLAAQYASETWYPDIQITGVDSKGTRGLTLTHFERDRRPISGSNSAQTLKYLADLWEYDVVLQNQNGVNLISTSGKYGASSGGSHKVSFLGSKQ